MKRKNYFDFMLLRKVLPQKLKRIRRNENKRKYWTFKYKGFYVICPNPDCKTSPHTDRSKRFRIPLYLPAEFRYKNGVQTYSLQDKEYSCSICGQVFRVLDVLNEDVDLYGDNWIRVKRWFKFWGWKKVEVYKPRSPLTRTP